MRERVLAFLVRCVADGLLTEAEAAGLLRRFDAGEAMSLPLDLGDGVQDLTADDVAAAQAWAAQFVDSDEQQHEDMRAGYVAWQQGLAEQLASGQIGVAAWQRGMLDAIKAHLVAQGLAGGMSVAEALAALGPELMTQAAFLSRFADEWLARWLMGRPMSAAEIANRALSYAGAGWGWFYRARERDTRDGWVVDYVSRDDPRTCGPCLDAEARGPYLPGTGPYPGQVCLGRGHCRCQRVERYDPEAWRRLVG